mgnify:FL=1
MAKIIFIQRKVEKLFENYIEYNWMYGRDGYSHLPKINEIRIFTNNENVIEEKVIGEYDIDSPPLDTGDEFYLCDIGKIVKIKKRVRNSDNSFTYYIEDELVETENTKISKEKCDKEFDKYCSAVEEFDALKEEFDAYKRKYKYRKKFFNFRPDKAPNDKNR